MTRPLVSSVCSGSVGRPTPYWWRRSDRSSARNGATSWPPCHRRRPVAKARRPQPPASTADDGGAQPRDGPDRHDRTFAAKCVLLVAIKLGHLLEWLESAPPPTFHQRPRLSCSLVEGASRRRSRSLPSLPASCVRSGPSTRP